MIYDIRQINAVIPAMSVLLAQPDRRAKAGIKDYANWLLVDSSIKFWFLVSGM